MPAPEVNARAQAVTFQQPEYFRQLRCAYDSHLAGLQELHQRLSLRADGTASAPLQSSDSPDCASPDSSEARYDTGAGRMTFEELYTRTRRIAGYTLCSQMGMSNPEDVDDCLQAGYFNIWLTLREKPDLFADKPLRYIVRAVVFRCKAQRYAHLRHYRKLVYDANPARQSNLDELSTRRIDTWIDLETAITQTAQEVEDHPALLLSLYTVITQTTAQEIRRTFGHSNKALTSGRQHIRTALKHHLPGYGTSQEPDNPPGRTAQSGAHLRHRVPLATLLLTDEIRRTKHKQNEHRTIARTEPIFISSARQRVRSQIRPLQREAGDPVYATGWKAQARFEDIITDAQVRRAAYAKLRFLGITNTDDADDCIQQGAIRLWKKLSADPHLLVGKGWMWTGIYLAYSSDTRFWRRYNARHARFNAPDFDWRDADEWLILDQSQRWDWTTQVDEQLDLERFMTRMAATYATDLRKLLVLYALTTSVKSKDIAPLLSVASNNFAAQYGNPMKDELRAVYLEVNGAVTPEPWTARLARGEGLEHITRIGHAVGGDMRKLLALYILTTSVTMKAVLETFGIGRTAFRRELRQVSRMLERAGGSSSDIRQTR